MNCDSKATKAAVSTYRYLFYQYIFNSQHNVLTTQILSLVCMRDPFSRLRMRISPTHVPIRQWKLERDATLKVSCMHTIVAILFELPAPFFESSRSNTCSQTGTHLARQSQGVCLGRATGKGRQSMFCSSLLHWSNNNRQPYSPNQLCFLSLKLLSTMVFNSHKILSCCIFNFFFLSFFFLVSLVDSGRLQIQDDILVVIPQRKL